MAGLSFSEAIVANDPAEAVYLNTATDPQGQQITGLNRYVMHFPSKPFGSVALHDANHNLVANDIDRYALRDHDKLKFNADGSFDTYVQNEPVTGDR